MENFAPSLRQQSAHDAARLGAQARSAARKGLLETHTAGRAMGNVQGNVVILPSSFAEDFMHFCQRNAKPCPLLACSAPGETGLEALGLGIDIRSDLPRYRVWKYGEVVDEPTSIENIWTDDLVTFVIGCSFSFEQALLADGIALRHVEMGRNVSMYRTSLQTQAAGPFSGPMVVSMRPMVAADAIRAVQISSHFPAVHGAPVHIGDPALIGINDLGRPDYGDPVDIRAGELPVFWACGVTPQAALVHARLPFAVTHAPGAMLVTDLLNRQLAAF